MNGNVEGRTAAARQLQARLDEEMGSPGKWQMLFTEGQGEDGQPVLDLVRGLADHIGGGVVRDSPTQDDPGKPQTAFLPHPAVSGRFGYEASIPVVHDWKVLNVFQALGFWDHLPRFYLAGERRRYFLDPTNLKAGILIAGGPAAGMNMVVDSVAKRLFALATQIVGRGNKHNLRLVGYRGGYLALRRRHWVALAPARSALPEAGAYRADEEVWFTDEWATEPGVRIKALREDPVDEAAEIARRVAADVEAIRAEGLDVLFVVGGNGTLAWAARVAAAYRKVPGAKRLVIVAAPKTMDNDVNFTDTTLGFRTAVDNAADFIRTIHNSAEAMDRLGVIELFGAASGFVALHAGYVSGVADLVMYPEQLTAREELLRRERPGEDAARVREEAYLQYEADVRRYLRGRMERNCHAVLVVAEGALGQFRHGNRDQRARAFSDFLARLTADRFKLADVRARYLMRDTAANSADLDLCKWTGKLMADTALAGFTDCSVQLWQGDYVLVPLADATARLKQVEPWSYYLQTLRDRERLALLGAGPPAGGPAYPPVPAS